MDTIRYVEMTDERHAEAIIGMMMGLYAEDDATAPRDPGRFGQTLRVFLSEPHRGRVILFLGPGDELHGYCIMIPIWSNELGGINAFVDELFVRAESRRRGIARGLFEFIERERPFGAVAVSLEASSKNQAAWSLYTSLGLEPRPFTAMLRVFS